MKIVKKYCLLSFFLFILSSFIGCAQYTQLYEVSSNSKMKKDNDYHVFENDTLKIIYSFWNERGVMSFSIYNKLNIPIYLDWKKCSFVKDGEKFDYWVDEEITDAVTYYKGYSLSNNFFRPTFYVAEGGNIVTYGKNITTNINAGASVGKSVKTKPQRIIFIAPKSAIYESKFLIGPNGGFKLNTDKSVITEARNDNLNKTTSIYVSEYKEKSILNFRNFLTFSTTEKFDTEFYIDNSFFVSRILEMDRVHFQGSQIIESEITYTYPFKSPASFYINIDKTTSIKYRKK